MDEEKLYSLISFIERSDNRRKILEYLQGQEEPQTPTSIAESTGIHRNHVSNQLSNLREKELVKVLNPDAPRHRYYKITNSGEIVFDNMQDR